MSDAELEAEARRRLRAKRDFPFTMIVFLVLSVMFVAIWALTGASSYFWPIWPIGGLLLAAVFMALNVYGGLRRGISQADVDAEVERMRRRG